MGVTPSATAEAFFKDPAVGLNTHFPPHKAIYDQLKGCIKTIFQRLSENRAFLKPELQGDRNIRPPHRMNQLANFEEAMRTAYDEDMYHDIRKGLSGDALAIIERGEQDSTRGTNWVVWWLVWREFRNSDKRVTNANPLGYGIVPTHVAGSSAVPIRRNNERSSGRRPRTSSTSAGSTPSSTAPDVMGGSSASVSPDLSNQATAGGARYSSDMYSTAPPQVPQPLAVHTYPHAGANPALPPLDEALASAQRPVVPSIQPQRTNAPPRADAAPSTPTAGSGIRYDPVRDEVLPTE